MTTSRTSGRSTTKSARPTLHAKKSAEENASAIESLSPGVSITYAELSRTYGGEERRAMIERLAYQYAESRGFAPGHEVDDWLAAEAEVDARLIGERVS